VTKNELRSELRERRKASVLKQNNQVPFNAEIEPILHSGASVGAYRATRWEADLTAWWAPLRQSGVTVALPYLADRAAAMEFRAWEKDALLEKAAFGFEQPSTDAAPVTPDILLIPLVGFDRSGTRLGQGAGHYDRYLALHSNALKIGIGFSCQEWPGLPKDPWDIPLDVIVTEREWITCVIPAEQQS
jgi:5-formyltetrahydrofolate cyclo-ligase